MVEKGALEFAAASPGYYSQMFVVEKALGDWRLIIDLSVLNRYVKFTKFHVETPQSVLQSICWEDCRISVNLKD